MMLVNSPMDPLGTEENPWPRWALLVKDHADEASYVAHSLSHCDRYGDISPNFVCNDQACNEKFAYERLISELATVIRAVEQALRNSGREDCRNFFAENILRIDHGLIYVKAFTCVNGKCFVPAECTLLDGVTGIRKKGWRNIQFDFEERTTN